MIEIDGSYREGGGQILRTALSLSCLFQKSFRIFSIRKGRKKPGLMPQHLTAVRAAQLLSGAEVTGDRVGSTDISFSPGETRGGEFLFDIGTAGATSLVLQTLIPAAVLSDITNDRSNLSSAKAGPDERETNITLKGGTHVPFSPSFHYLEGVFAPFLKMIGLNIQLSIESYGFYPKGGGKIRAVIFPAKEIKPLMVGERGDILRLTGYSGVGSLPVSIAERQRDALSDKIYSELSDLKCPFDIELKDVSTPGQGTFVFLMSESKNSMAGFASLGERGKKAELVGEEAATGFLNYYATGAALDPHMSDQIVLYLSVCKEESFFTTSSITEHLITNLWVIGLFHEYQYSIEGEVGRPGLIRIKPSVDKMLSNVRPK